jgi:hypothetical protein
MTGATFKGRGMPRPYTTAMDQTAVGAGHDRSAKKRATGRGEL